MSATTLDVDSNSFYWVSRLIGALADADYAASIQLVERYQGAVAARSHEIIRCYDQKMMKENDYSLIDEANEAIAEMAKEEATKALNNVLLERSKHMKCNYNRADN